MPASELCELGFKCRYFVAQAFYFGQDFLDEVKDERTRQIPAPMRTEAHANLKGSWGAIRKTMKS
jgi:hypothetical protein